MSGALTIRPVHGLPEVQPGDDLAALIIEALAAAPPPPGSVVCIAQKLVSKAEGRIVALAEVAPSPLAKGLAEDREEGDPRHIQVILDASAELVRADRGILICRTPHGFICANAGVDRSNAPEETAILLPEDPDGSARALRVALQAGLGVQPLGVVICDSFGRAWRYGQVDVAIGAAGVVPTIAEPADRSGRALRSSAAARLDELAAAAGLARSKGGDEGVVVIEGAGGVLPATDDGAGAAALLRDPAHDLFR